jgi:hypothetical protein
VVINVIRDSDIRDLNPWWKNKDKINDDKKIREWQNSTIKYDPRLRRKINYDFEPNNSIVYTLRGPRQVGKTTLVKIQIKEFLEKGISPWNILYYSLDLANTQQDVVDVVEKYMKMTKRQRGDNRCYLFLDEASSVHDFQKGIKWLVDNDKIQNCTVMATGSQAISIKNATERLPGRKGRLGKENYDKILLPMKFVEYASIQNKDIKNFIMDNDLLSFDNRKTIIQKLINHEIDKKIDELNSYQNELNDILFEYMLTGGTPKVIDEKITAGEISEDLYTSYLDGFKGEWSALKKNEVLLKQFCGSIISSLGSHISWNDISKNASLGSPNTATDYAHSLKDLFVLTMVHMYGENKKIPLIQKEKKFYFHDPFFFHIFNGWLSAKNNFETSQKYLEDEINQGKIVEGIVADHLIRLAFLLSDKKQTFDYFNHVFYWKDDKNREVDFVLYDGNSIEVPIEVKFRNKINAKELAGLVNFLTATKQKSGLVLSKYELDTRQDYVIIPTSVFLLLI